MSNRSKRYKEEFKKQIVELINNGKNVTEIVNEYNIARSTVNKWVKDYSTSGSFKAKDNRTQEENELIKLRKENQRLKMENDILKQAALIMGQK
jgi:transposase